MLDQKTLDDVIRRVAGVARPEKIILFGSAARGATGPDSDIDLIIIVKEGADELDLMARIYRKQHGVGVAVDAIVVTHGDVERFKDSHALIIKPALREGRVVYPKPLDGGSVIDGMPAGGGSHPSGTSRSTARSRGGRRRSSAPSPHPMLIGC